MSGFKDYVDDFYKRYEHPSIGNVTVGFSGIDPSQRALAESSVTDLTDTQINLIDGLIKNYLSKLEIHIDSGNIDPATEDTSTPYATLKPSEIPHEELGGLLGGSDKGHYHLTKDEYDKLGEYPDLDVLTEVLKHNELSGLQGGQSGDYYHLTKDDVAKLQKLIETFISNYNDDYQVIVPSTGEKSHEALQSLMGGNTKGHYHLTEDELEALKKLKTALMPTGTEIDLPEGTIDHEELNNLQGGTTGEHYHMTQAELNALRKMKDAIISSAGEVKLPEVITDHEKLTNLLGGVSNGHYHLSKDEVLKLGKLSAALIDAGGEVSLPEEGAKDHEELDNLQGGKDNEHYHLTEDEAEKLSKLSTALIDTDGNVTVPDSGTDDHEELNSLLGGGDSGHYHLTGLELERVKTILSVLYPMGATKPVFPSGTDYSDISGDPFAGLPKGKAPNWTPNSLPFYNNTQFTLFAGVGKMYYGEIPHIYNYSYATSGLFVPMKYNNYYYFMNTSNLTTWHAAYSGSTGSNVTNILATSNSTYHKINYSGKFEILDNNICQYVYNKVGYSQKSTPANLFGHCELWCCSATMKTTYATVYGFWDTSTSSSSNGSLYSSPAGWAVTGLASDVYCAVATSELLDCAIIVGASGYCYKKVRQKAFTATRYTIGTPVNPACAAWSPDAYVFCVTGPEGTATSADGQNWEVHTDAPHNLVDMSYRSDLNCFFARGGDDKLFYASTDGAEWSQVNSTPIPLDTVAAVDYNPDLQWYCAIGGTSKYAYFSKDLEHWVRTTVTNGAAIDMGSVIWMPNTKKYVLMPTSGTYFYTFNPSEWSDE